jgi:hypothetical protein
LLRTKVTSDQQPIIRLGGLELCLLVHSYVIVPTRQGRWRPSCAGREGADRVMPLAGRGRLGGGTL